MLRVSVITVTYNAAHCVQGVARSIESQQYCNLEWVVVDGGSTDETVSLVGGCRGLTPQVHSGPDAGIYDAMNKGLAFATGDAVLFMNADDRFAQPESLGALAELLATRSDCDIAVGDALVWDGQADTYRSHRHLQPQRLGFEPLCHQAVLARRSAFDRVGGFDLQYRISADLDWFMRCAVAGLHFCHTPRLVCRYQTGGMSDVHAELRRRENDQILRTHRTRAQRLRERLAAAGRRRVRKWLTYAS